MPEPRPLEEFRSYLVLLARAHLHPFLKGRVEPSDVVQQSLLEAHRDQARFRGGSDGERAAWLRRILFHNLANQVRDLQRQRRDAGREQALDQALGESEAHLAEWLAADQSTPSARVVRAEEQLRLARAVEALPEAWREAVILRHWHGWSLSEIASHLDRGPAAVAGLLHRGLARLRASLPEAEAGR